MILQRGCFPVQLYGDPLSVSDMPGISVSQHGILYATEDAARVAAPLLGIEPPLIAAEDTLSPAQLWGEVQAMPGFTHWQQLQREGKGREYQWTGSVFLARRGYALLGDAMRLGKTRTVLFALTLIKAQKTLIVCPADIKRGWQREIDKVLGESSVSLFGRAADRCRVWCLECHGDGCKSCRRTGSKWVRGQEAVAEAIQAAKFVIVNYDVIAPHMTKDAAGKKYTREDLPGWASFLSQFHFKVSVLDEAHRIRGWQAGYEKASVRRDHIRDLVDSFDRCWAVTGTPTCGFTRDYWGILDIISGGVWGHQRLPFQFHSRYCNGHKGEYGWVSEGRSELADTELVERLKVIMLQRTRKECVADMPPKQRIVQTVETAAPIKAIPKSGTTESRITKMLRGSFKEKQGPMVEAILDELAEGGKVQILAQRKETAKVLGAALDKAICGKRSKHRRRLEEKRANVWCVVGEQPEVRSRQQEAFVKHNGAAAYVSTIAACQVGSLMGVQTVHYAEIDYSPDKMLQSEDRGYEPGTNGLTIVYWVCEGVDQKIVEALLPKIETVDKISRDAEAGSLAQTFSSLRQEVLQDAMTELMAMMPDNFDEEGAL